MKVKNILNQKESHLIPAEVTSAQAGNVLRAVSVDRAGPLCRKVRATAAGTGAETKTRILIEQVLPVGEATRGGEAAKGGGHRLVQRRLAVGAEVRGARALADTEEAGFARASPTQQREAHRLGRATLVQQVGGGVADALLRQQRVTAGSGTCSLARLCLNTSRAACKEIDFV